jgi:hypothetical protein
MISRTVAGAPSFGREQSVPQTPALPVSGRPLTGALSRPAAPLLRFLLVLLFAFGLMCIYLWQLSTVTSMTYEIDDIRATAAVLERTNAQLAGQVAAQNAPRVIEQAAKERGMGPVATPVFVAQPNPNPPAGSSDNTGHAQPALP